MRSLISWVLAACCFHFGDSAGCFLPSTKVTMADGSLREIGNVKIGEWVTSWDEAKQVAVSAKVMNIKRTQRLDLMQVKCASNQSSSSSALSSLSNVITSTRDHPYWSLKQASLISANPSLTEENYGLKAKEFLDEEVLQSIDGSGVKCEVVSRTDSEVLREVMTLQLEEHHWYFVEGVRVHNKGGGSCFVPSTQITMADGTETRAIGDVQIGDSVLSWDENKDVATVAKVKNVRRSQRSEMLHVTVQATQTTIVSTSDHPYWSMKQMSLVSADPVSTQAKYGLPTSLFHAESEMLQAANGSGVLCSAKEVRSERLLDVITLELEGHHWYFAEGVRVHNKGSSSGYSSGYSSSYSSYSSSSHYSTYYPYYPIYYSRSPYCSRNPSSPQCSSSGSSSIECGCVNTSVPVASFQQFCPQQGLKGGCWTSGQDPNCVPTSPQMPLTDTRYVAATAACARQIDDCENITECAGEMSRNNYSAGVLYWTNFSTFPSNASNEFLSLSRCMSANINFCNCEWEVCERNYSAGFYAAVILAPIFGVVFIVICALIIRRRKDSILACCGRAPSPYPTRNPLIDSCKHVFETLTCTELANRTNQIIYNEGFICDVCKGSFAPNIKPTHCFGCGLDFCDGCLLNLGGGAQILEVELPQYNEPRSAACLENLAHAQYVKEKRSAEMGAEYEQGFICDACHGKFPFDVPFHRCELCSLDFCSGCSIRRVKTAPAPFNMLVNAPNAPYNAQDDLYLYDIKKPAPSEEVLLNTQKLGALSTEEAVVEKPPSQFNGYNSL